MKRLIATAFCLAAAATVYGPIAAQTGGTTQPGTRAPAAGVVTPQSRSRVTDGEFDAEFDNRRAMDPTSDFAIHGAALQIASCVARRGGDGAGQYVGGSLANDAEFERLTKVLSGKYSSCTKVKGSASVAAISGALAEHLLIAKVPSLEDRATGVSGDAARKFFGDLTGMVTFDNIAGCLAVYSPGLAYKLINTEAGSAEEKSALASVFAQSPECKLAAPPSSIPILSQRAGIATALYQWTAK